MHRLCRIVSPNPTSGKAIKYDKRRNRIQIMFGRLKDGRRGRNTRRPMPESISLCHCWTGEGPAFPKIGGRVVCRLEEVLICEQPALRIGVRQDGLAFHPPRHRHRLARQGCHGADTEMP